MFKPPHRPARKSSNPAGAANSSEWSHLLFRPAIGLKRWLGVLLAGVFLLSLALAILLRYIFSGPHLAAAGYWLTLQFLPVGGRLLLLAAAGSALAILGWRRVQHILLAYVLPDLGAFENGELFAVLLRRYRRSRGPRIVTIGGGTGMPQLLRGLRKYTDNITAIVTVADDGGSSGRLRRTMGILPPGDFRNNIAALSEVEGLMVRLFQYRFADRELGDPEADNELAGHSFGNLFITTMAAITGSFEAGIAESSKVLRVRGRVLPGTLEDVTLCAEVRRLRPDGEVELLTVEGESMLPKAGGQVERVYLKQERARAYPEAIRAILQADLIVAGPGSFFTSVLPNLLVTGVRDAICASSAPRIYICNVATQSGETDHFGVSEHMAKLREHAGNAFPNALANDNYDTAHPPAANAQWVHLPAKDELLAYRLFTGDIVDDARPWRHDSEKLAARIIEVYADLRSEQDRQELAGGEEEAKGEETATPPAA
jgi:uncharacterized cofD-like protein